jgi:transposase
MPKNVAALNTDTHVKADPVRPKHTIGIDLGDRMTHFCVLNTDGSIAEEGSFRTEATNFERLISRFGISRVAVEVGMQSRWVSNLLIRAGHEVIVANARSVRLIADSKHKSDRIDARMLARLARLDPTLLAPIVHRSIENYPDHTVLKARDLLVRTRTKMINSIRGMAKATGIRLPSCATDGFAKRVSALIPDVLKASLGPILTTIQTLTDQISSFDKLILGMIRAKYPETERLMQVHGVGPITAMEYVLTIEDPGRFSKSRQVASFIGLQPKQRQSGDRSPQLGISKQGNSHLRRLLVQCAHHILGCWGPALPLQADSVRPLGSWQRPPN